MSGTFLAFPKVYEIDEVYCSLILRFIRHEIITNVDSYTYQPGLKHFVADLEKYHWHRASQTVITFGNYCGGVKSHSEFARCLNRVRDLLVVFGDTIPIEWKEKLKVTPDDEYVPVELPVKRVVYWLDCLRQAVDEYRPLIGVTTFPFPPE